MDLSIIIAHFDPGNHPVCVASFKKTLETISSQNENYNIEVIIADDGSPTNKIIRKMETQSYFSKWKAYPFTWKFFT